MKLLKEIVFGGLLIVGLILAASEPVEPSCMLGIANLIGLLCVCGAVLVGRRI